MDLFSSSAEQSKQTGMALKLMINSFVVFLSTLSVRHFHLLTDRRMMIMYELQISKINADFKMVYIYAKILYHTLPKLV